MKFMDNLIPVLPFMVCLFWTVHAGISFRELNKAQRYLGLFLSVSMILFLCHAVYYSNDQVPGFSVWNVIYSWATLTVYPVYYIYIRTITDNRRLDTIQWAVLFVPGILAAVLSVAALTSGLNHRVPEVFVSIVRPVQTILISVLSILRLTAFDRSVHDSYSEVEGKTAKPFIVLAVLQLTAALCTVVLSIIGQQFFMGKTVIAVPSVLFSGTIYAIAYVGFRYRFDAIQMEEELMDNAVIRNIPQGMKEGTDLYNIILAKMENDQIFLQPGLSVVDLAHSINSNRSYVSTCINTGSGKSFALFVNTYRVEYAQKIMQQNPSLSMAQVSEMSGFASEESFRRNFKIITGKSPSQWIGS